MLRILYVISVVTLLSTAPLAHAQEQTLQPPANLSAETYSSSAVEVFWSRTQGAVAYIVRRDNELLEQIDGTSFFEEGLEPRTTFQYEIRSVDAAGNESGSALITVTTRGGNPETDPSRPLGLRADVYSNTALELFWRGVFVFGARPTYEIARDGVVIGTSDGTSFFEDELAPGTTYEYSIQLLDSSSPPATITVTTNGASRSPTVGGPLLENVSLVVYSETAAELFWDRPALEVGIDRVEILRGIGNVATESLGRTNGTSFFDEDREPGVSYSYALLARDSSGNILDRINISADEAEDADSIDFVSPILGEFNQIEILNLVFSALSGQAFGNDVLRLPYHSDPTYSNAQLLGGAPVDAVVADTVCDNGGTALFEPVQFPGSNDSGWNFDFDNCLDGTEIIDGELTRLISSAVQVRSELGISIDGSEREAQYSGSMSRTFTTPRGGSIARTMTGDDLNVVYTEDNETFELINGNFSYVQGFPFSVNMEGGFGVRSQLSQNRILDVLIIDPFEWNRDTSNQASTADRVAFNSGSMIIFAEDCTELQVDADADNLGDFLRVVALNTDDSVSIVNIQWAFFSESLQLFTPEF